MIKANEKPRIPHISSFDIVFFSFDWWFPTVQTCSILETLSHSWRSNDNLGVLDATIFNHLPTKNDTLDVNHCYCFCLMPIQLYDIFMNVAQHPVFDGEPPKTAIFFHHCMCSHKYSHKCPQIFGRWLSSVHLWIARRTPRRCCPRYPSQPEGRQRTMQAPLCRVDFWFNLVSKKGKIMETDGKIIGTWWKIIEDIGTSWKPSWRPKELIEKMKESWTISGQSCCSTWENAGKIMGTSPNIMENRGRTWKLIRQPNGVVAIW